jgi:hypothetical protein
LTLVRVWRAALLVLAGGAAAYASGPPRFAWANSGLRVDHPPAQGAAALVGALLLGVAAFGARPRALAILGGAAALGLCLLGADRLAWRLDAVDTGLSERTTLGWTRLGWQEIASVDLLPNALLVRSRSGVTVTLGTGAYPADERSRLERTIARRVHEASLR